MKILRISIFVYTLFLFLIILFSGNLSPLMANLFGASSAVNDILGRVALSVLAILPLLFLSKAAANKILKGDNLNGSVKEDAASELRYRSLVQMYPEVVFVFSRERIEFVNDFAVNFIGAKSKEDIIGRSALSFLHPDEKEKLAGFIQGNLLKGDQSPKKGEVRLTRFDGKVITVELTVTVIDFKGQLAFLGMLRDITEKKQAENQLKMANKMLESLSNLDGLTGIPNRRYFDESLTIEWDLAYKQNRPISLLMIDIDYFKEFNDTYGHLEGDACLRRVARTLQETIPVTKGIVARYGGEEFSIILPKTVYHEAKGIASLVCEKIEHLRISHISSPVKQIVTISVGLATIIPNENHDCRVLIDQADKALYESKRGGRNRVSNLSENAI